MKSGVVKGKMVEVRTISVLADETHLAGVLHGGGNPDQTTVHQCVQRGASLLPNQELRQAIRIQIEGTAYGEQPRSFSHLN